MSDVAGADEWAGRFEQQADACATLGSVLWARLLRIVAVDVAAGGPSWDVVERRAELRYGQAGPLRLVGTAHRLALAGDAPEWAALLPSCGGSAPAAPAVPALDTPTDAELRAAWLALVAEHGDALVAGLDREVQTNEVGRAAALGYAHAVALAHLGSGRRSGRDVTTSSAEAVGETEAMPARLIELGCSGGLNLRLDRFRLELAHGPRSTSGGLVLGDPDGPVRLVPDLLAPVDPDLSTSSTVRLVERIGIDPHPIDPTTDDGRLTLLSFVWPDQVERFERLAAAIELAREVPASLVATAGRSTAEVLEEVLAGPAPPGVATIVQHSIVWQYIPTDQRSAVTAAIESAGERATAENPLVWVRFEPDVWDRTRVAVSVRSWPDGGDRLVAHADFHGRWLTPVPSGSVRRSTRKTL